SACGLALIRMRLRADEANFQPCVPGDRYHLATSAIAQRLIDVLDLPGWQPDAVELEGHAIHAGMRARPDVSQDRYAVGASCIRTGLADGPGRSLDFRQRGSRDRYRPTIAAGSNSSEHQSAQQWQPGRHCWSAALTESRITKTGHAMAPAAFAATHQ